MTAKQREFMRPILDGSPIPDEQREYFRARLEDRLAAALIRAFCAHNQGKPLTNEYVDGEIEAVAQRLGVKGFVVRRCMFGDYLTLDRISDIMLALGMDFDDFTFTPIAEKMATKPDEPRA